MRSIRKLGIVFAAVFALFCIGPEKLPYERVHGADKDLLLRHGGVKTRHLSNFLSSFRFLRGLASLSAIGPALSFSMAQSISKLMVKIQGNL